MLDAMAEHTASTLNKPDVALEMTLRPSLFSDFTGQPKVKERLEIAVAAAKQRGEALDHILLVRPARSRQNHHRQHSGQGDGRERQGHQRPDD